MASITRDFLESRRKANRYPKFILLLIIIFLIVAGSAVAGFYFYQKPSRTAKTSGQVAAATTSGIDFNLPKDWLLKYFGTDNENDAKVGGPEGDPDGDGLTNRLEYYFGADPTKADTDGDGVPDGVEVALSQNPNGSGNLQLSAPIQDQVREYISSDKDLQQFTADKIESQIADVLQPDRAIVFDMPKDTELVITNENDVPALEKYYNDTQGLLAADQSFQGLGDALLNLTPAEVDSNLKNLQTTITLMKQTPVPAQLLNIHRLRIAGLNAGVKIFEMLRDRYNSGNPDPQFWSDLFYQSMIAQSAGQLELVAWRGIGLELKDKGGI